MGSELNADGAASGISVSVGERVTLGDSDAEYVVMSVNHATGRLELLRLNPGRIERDVPVASIRKKAANTPRQVDEPGK